MVGIDHMILQLRDRDFLREFSIVGVVDGAQAKVIAGFGSISRTNKRLLKLTRGGLLRRFFLGSGGGRKALYALSRKGALVAGVPFRGPRRPEGAVLAADFFVEHQLAVNALYCLVKFQMIPVAGVHFHRWVAFHEAISKEIRLMPDGYLELVTPSGIAAAFLEVDLGNESLTIWREKIRKYLQLALTGAYQRMFGHDRFRVLVVANSVRRMDSLRKTTGAVTEKIFRFATLEDARQMLFGRVWRKPLGNHTETLTD